MSMDIYVNTRGTYLHRKDDKFLLEVDGNKTKVSPDKVRSIVLSTGVMLSTDVIKLALDHNIDLLVLDDFGNPYGRFWHSRFGSTAFIRRRQLEVFESEEGLGLAMGWIRNKLESSIDHLKKLEYKRHSKVELIEEEIGAIRGYIEKLNGLFPEEGEAKGGSIEELRNSIMGYEGNAARHYYRIVAHLIPEPYEFKGRSMRPAKDEFNCLLNYGFGILYGRVERACVIAGLDPFVGILHCDNYNKKSFVFDLIENYRHLVWETVFKLFSRKEVKKSLFEEIKGGLKLNKEGKQIVQANLGEKLDKKVLYKGKKLTNLNIIQADCHEIANGLIKDREVE